MIGIYAHHVGSGHLHRCRALQATLGEPSVIFSSDSGADVQLPLDIGEDAASASANDTLHWAPTGVPGLRHRLAKIATWIAENNPRAFYVDVSVEVALFVRLMGIPVATLAMPGIREDPPHQLGYAQADAIIAAWPSWVPVPGHLRAHADRLHQVGGITRLTPEPGIQRERKIVVLQGKGGDDWEPERWRSIAERHPEYTWEFLGGNHRVADPMRHLQTASLVIAAAGQNSVADIAAAGTPAIILAQDRPHQEQLVTAEILRTAGLATAPAHPLDLNQWAGLITQALNLRPAWHRWQTDGAVQRAAHLLEEL